MKIKKIKNIIDEAQFIKEKKLDYRLVKIFSKDLTGTKQEWTVLNKFHKSLKNVFYIEVIYILTHKIIHDSVQAKKIYDNILLHRSSLSKKLKRKVGIEVATLDYMKNILNMFSAPNIIETGKVLELVDKAVIDNKTGVYGYDSLMTNLEVEMERSKRHRRPLSVFFIDLDDFKIINDKFGHEAGDWMLKKMVEAINRNIRISDTVFRYGGDEFICILPETDLKSAEFLAKRVHQSIISIPVIYHGHKLPIKLSVCIGIAEFGQQNLNTPELLISAADKMMYRAKQSGKNKICKHEVESPVQRRDKTFESTDRQKSKARSIHYAQVLSFGYALGKAFIYKDILSRDLLSYSISEKEIDSEYARIKDALNVVMNDICRMKESVESNIGSFQSQIFEFHQEVLRDRTLLTDFEMELKNEFINAEQVVKNIFRKWANRFKSSENEKLKSAADDLDDICRRILRVLMGYEKNVLEHLPPDSIVIAKRLLPSDTVHLKRSNVKGIIVEEGSISSHSAILAKALEIPALTGVKKIFETINNEDELFLDGDQGLVVINPGIEDKQTYIIKSDRIIQSNQKANRIAFKKIYHSTGERITVNANASSDDDIKTALSHGADGIGLFRMEQIYLASKIMPDEHYLFEYLSNLLEQISGKKIVLRLLDIGGDKILPYIDIQDKISPFLGLRGIRMLLKYENLLKTQLRVALKLANRFQIHILLPMVSFAEEIITVKNMVLDCMNNLSRELNSSLRDVKIGSMIETPAAVINIKEIAAHSDFLSIGTNDLIQYTMAAGRENQSVSEYYKQGPKMIMGQVREIIKTANKLSLECSVCGELAGDPEYIQDLLNSGVRNFSVSPHLIPHIKEQILKLVSRKNNNHD